jgi:preprotein translocase subunit SecE
MARNRQRAKQRQAERRAARLAAARPDAVPSEAAIEEAELLTGAPPEDTGRSDTVVEHPPPAPELEGDDVDLEEPVVDAVEPETTPARRGDGRAAQHELRPHRNRLLAFLVAVWAELQRVEWPNRQALTMLTGVVLLFVVIMGAFLGGLDAVFSRLIDKIL